LSELRSYFTDEPDAERSPAGSRWAVRHKIAALNDEGVRSRLKVSRSGGAKHMAFTGGLDGVDPGVVLMD
jgi:hypothetical protein